MEWLRMLFSLENCALLRRINQSPRQIMGKYLVNRYSCATNRFLILRAQT